VSEFCGDRQASCVCSASYGHEGPHGCFGRDRCKGTWDYSTSGEVVYLTNPLTGQTFGEWFDGMFSEG
jgi:hypothetical protein